MRAVWNITSGKWEEQPTSVVGLQRPFDCVNLWWGMFLVTSCLGNSVSQASWWATTAHQTLLATRATLFADAFGIAAMLAAVTLVRNVTALQRPVFESTFTETAV